MGRIIETMQTSLQDKMQYVSKTLLIH